MIVMDIESSGLDSGKAGIWQIGAIELENPKHTFLEEARIDDEDEVTDEALKVIGKTEEELRDPKKQTQKQLLLNFFEWAKTCKERIIIGQNVGWDLSFIQNKSLRYGISDKLREAIGHRAFDLHMLAQIKYKEKHGKYLLREGGRSGMKLPIILEFCGIEDPRREVEGGNITKEGNAHNALEDAKLTAECFRRLTK
jgi:DNA polymerase III epsilon subunit-like protein